jgi:carbon-monoxide dehydrogenase iron sulfur subunit
MHSESGNLIGAIQEDPVSSPRIHVLGLDDGGGIVRLRSVALQCRQCEEPACAEACIAGGVVKDEETGVVRFDGSKCVGCWSCVMVCPFGAIVRRSKDGRAVKCNLCIDQEELACVAACPTRALVFCEPEEFEPLFEKAVAGNENSEC